MLRGLWLIFLLNQSVILIGQSKQDYNWQLGANSSPLSHSSPKSLEFTFNNNERLIRTFYRPMYMGHFSTSICDLNGNLLLYSNGCFINNDKHEVIPGSEHLSPGEIDLEWCSDDFGNYPITEGGLFLPFHNDSLIILLHQKLSVSSSPLTIYVDALFYTKLEKGETSYNITEKSISIIEDSLTYGRLEAIRGEKVDYWWVIQGSRNSNKYYTIGWDSGILDTTFIQAIGDSTVRKGEGAAQSVFSSDGTKYARYSPADDLYLFDFDVSTGVLSNYRKIHVADSGMIGGLAFSPSSQFLYACTTQDLYQFDVWAADIQSTRTHIAHYDGYVSTFPASFYYMQLGPDCKIYIITPNGMEVMHVINFPDNRGTSCYFEQHGIILPSTNTITIPNFPVFRVSPDTPCDPTISTFTFEAADINGGLKVYPNPTKDVINIDLDDQLAFETIQVNVIDFTGNLHISKEVENAKSVQLDLSMLKGGIYTIQFQGNKFLRYIRIFKSD